MFRLPNVKMGALAAGPAVDPLRAAFIILISDGFMLAFVIAAPPDICLDFRCK